MIGDTGIRVGVAVSEKYLVVRHDQLVMPASEIQWQIYFSQSREEGMAVSDIEGERSCSRTRSELGS